MIAPEKGILAARNDDTKHIPKEIVDIFEKYQGQGLAKRQQIGATCFQDDLLSDLESIPMATPFCSAFIGIPAHTATSTITPTS